MYDDDWLVELILGFVFVVCIVFLILGFAVPLGHTDQPSTTVRIEIPVTTCK